jgi:hypothetical protein
VRRSVLPLAAVGVLACAPLAAYAALPTKHTHYRGKTSQGRPIVFDTTTSSRKLTGFEVGRAGPPPSGVKVFCSNDRNDFIDTRIRVNGEIPITSRGTFKLRAHVRGSIQEGDFKLYGRFRTRRRATGTLRLDSTRFSDSAHCTSGLLTFSARAR